MEIIDTIAVYQPDPWILWTIAGLFFIAFVAGLYASESKSSPIPVAIVSVTVVSAIVLFLLVCNGNWHHFSYNKYVIRVNDDVSFTEMYDKYEVIDKEKYTNIYTVKLKDEQ